MDLKEQILKMFREKCANEYSPDPLSYLGIRYSLDISPYADLQPIREAVAELVQEGHLVRYKDSECHSFYGLAEDEKISIHKEIIAEILQDSLKELTPVQIAGRTYLRVGYINKVLDVLKAEGRIQEAGFKKTSRNTLYRIQG